MPLRMLRSRPKEPSMSISNTEITSTALSHTPEAPNASTGPPPKLAKTSPRAMPSSTTSARNASPAERSFYKALAELQRLRKTMREDAVRQKKMNNRSRKPPYTAKWSASALPHRRSTPVRFAEPAPPRLQSPALNPISTPSKLSSNLKFRIRRPPEP
jgi:hypothetical protein